MCEYRCVCVYLLVLLICATRGLLCFISYISLYRRVYVYTHASIHLYRSLFIYLFVVCLNT